MRRVAPLRTAVRSATPRSGSMTGGHAWPQAQSSASSQTAGSASSPPTTTRSSSSIGAASRPAPSSSRSTAARPSSSTSRRAPRVPARSTSRRPDRRRASAVTTTSGPPPRSGAGGPFSIPAGPFDSDDAPAGGPSPAAILGPMASFRAPRGTRDLLPDERAVFDRLQRIAVSLTQRYGYRLVETPLFEQAAVFERGIGEVTDVVEKELFRIAPRSEEAESWALRPEPTAGIVRAYVQHGMQTLPQPVKLTMTGPMFRYDRPQAGRYRQFWQFDIEAIGDPGPAVDAEIIELGYRFYRDAGLTGVEVHLNSIGDGNCRPAYVAELTEYFRAHREELPELERDRLERNVLRLLDSHDPAMAALNAAAPKITDRLCADCAAHFAGVRAHLDALGLSYRLDPGLVRGLDYYTRTAFEFYVT